MRHSVWAVSISRVSQRSRHLLVALAIGAFLVALEAFAPGVVMASGDATPPQDAKLASGAIVGIIASFVLAALLLMVALPLILPKPPGK